MIFKRAICLFLTVTTVLPLFGCQAPEATENEKSGQQVQPESAQQTHSDNELSNLFTYDVANPIQFEVKAAPQEEEAYQYPWGAYDDPIDTSGDGELSGGAGDAMDDDQREKQIQEALSKRPPDKRKAAEEAMRKAQEQVPPQQEDQQLPDDWENDSNQIAFGGRLEFSSGDIGVVIELSEYCVAADTTFTVTPIKESKLPPEFLQGGFSLVDRDKEHVTLNDNAVVTFITKDDPGEDVVIKSFSEDGAMEYVSAEVMKVGDAYMITGAVEHFSTVGYGVARLPALAPEISKESTEILRKFAEEQIEQMRREREQKVAVKKVVRTIEFDEILYTKSAAGHPLQLHLRAKLLEKPKAMGGGVVSLTERAFEGKIWVKFYTWMPGGYGVMYMLCNDAVIDDPNAISWIGSLTESGVGLYTATIRMVSIGGSQSFAEGLGTADISGKSYSSVQTDWAFDTATGNIKVTFTNMKGAMDKTFITGKLRAKTERQANKKLKWFLD